MPTTNSRRMPLHHFLCVALLHTTVPTCRRGLWVNASYNYLFGELLKFDNLTGMDQVRP